VRRFGPDTQHRHLRTGFPVLFPHVLLLGMLPTDHAQLGLQGMFSGGSGLVSLETAGLPGVWHLIERGASLGNVRSGLMASPRPPYASIGKPLESAGLPDRSSAPRRVGATNLPDTQHRKSMLGRPIRPRPSRVLRAHGNKRPRVTARKPHS
jgi:hypothetical protein